MIICIHETSNYGGEQDSVYFIDTTKAKGLTQQENDFMKGVNNALKIKDKMTVIDADNTFSCSGGNYLDYIIVNLPLKVDKYVNIYYE